LVIIGISLLSTIGFVSSKWRQRSDRCSSAIVRTRSIILHSGASRPGGSARPPRYAI